MLEGVYVRRIWNERFDAYSGIGDVADAIPFLLRRIWTPIHLFFIYKVPGEVSRDQLSGHCYSRTLLIQSRRTTCHKTTLHDPLRTAWDLFRTIDETLSMQVPYSAGPHAREYWALFLPPRTRNTKLSILFADREENITLQLILRPANTRTRGISAIISHARHSNWLFQKKILQAQDGNPTCHANLIS